MKKIALTISRGWIAKNLLHNDFYKILRTRCEVLIFTPAYKDARFIKEFRHPNVRFFPLDAAPWRFSDRFIFTLHRFLIWSPSVGIRFRYGVFSDGKVRSRPVYFTIKLLFTVLSKFRFLRSLVRWYDAGFLQRKEVDKFLEVLAREKPALVIAANPAENGEAALLKAAKKLRIPCWATPKSWDSLFKSGLRAKADYFIVWGEYTKSEAIKSQNYRPEDIFITGVLRYDDFFVPRKTSSYEEFCSVMGLDPMRRTILFASEGKWFPYDKDIASIIAEMIEHDELIAPCQLLVRPHYGYKDDEKKFVHLQGKKHVVVDMYNQPSNDFKDRWDYSEEFTRRWLNSIYHASVTVSTHSSISLDAAACDRPAIDIGFDGYRPQPYARSVARFAKDCYREVFNTGGVRCVYSRQELKQALNDYLDNCRLNAAGREVLRNKFCFKLDGKSGERFAKLVMDFLGE